MNGNNMFYVTFFKDIKQSWDHNCFVQRNKFLFLLMRRIEILCFLTCPSLHTRSLDIVFPRTHYKQYVNMSTHPECFLTCPSLHTRSLDIVFPRTHYKQYVNMSTHPE